MPSLAKSLPLQRCCCFCFLYCRGVQRPRPWLLRQRPLHDLVVGFLTFSFFHFILNRLVGHPYLVAWKKNKIFARDFLTAPVYENGMYFRCGCGVRTQKYRFLQIPNSRQVLHPSAKLSIDGMQRSFM